MLAIKGNTSRQRGKPFTPPRKKVADDVQYEAPARKRVRPEVESGELPRAIDVPRTDEMNVVPRSTWQQSKFRWDPVPFALESERLNEKIVEAETQNDSMRRWLKDATLPIIYTVCGNPDEVKARYFAAWLAFQHVKQLGVKANVVWWPVYGGFDNPLLNKYDSGLQAPPTLIVLTNLAVNSGGQKVEKARDLLDKFSYVPRIVVGAGTDPISLCSTVLHVPCHSLAYFSEQLVKKKVEVL